MFKQISLRGRGVWESCHFRVQRTSRLEWSLSRFAGCNRGLPRQQHRWKCKILRFPLFHSPAFPLFVSLSHLNELGGLSFVSPPGTVAKGWTGLGNCCLPLLVRAGQGRSFAGCEVTSLAVSWFLRWDLFIVMANKSHFLLALGQLG